MTIFPITCAIGVIGFFLFTTLKPSSAQVATSPVNSNKGYFRDILAQVFDGKLATIPLNAGAISKTEYSSDMIANIPLSNDAIEGLVLDPPSDIFSVNAAFDQMRSTFADGPIGASDGLLKYAVSYIPEREISVYVFQSETGVSALFLRDY